MYNRRLIYLTAIEIFFFFLKKSSLVFKWDITEHAMMQLIDQINNCFEKNHFTLGLLIDLFKAFDNTDRYILTKLKNGVKRNNIRWF